MNLNELKRALSNLDEITLLEVLDLHSDEIVAKFSKEISERYDELRFKVEEPYVQIREEERFEPLTGELNWKTPDTEAFSDDDDDGRSPRGDY